MTPTQPAPDDWTVDVLVVGGGPAGLSAALTLGRSRRSVLVVDAGAPRNGPAEAVHGFLTRDGTPPQDLLELARAEVARYGVDLHAGRAVSLSRVGESVPGRPGRRRDGARPAVGRHDRSPRRAAAGPRAGGAVGARRHPLPALPRLGGPRPYDRGARDFRLRAAPGGVVPCLAPRARAPRQRGERRTDHAAPSAPTGRGGGRLPLLQTPSRGYARRALVARSPVRPAGGDGP